MKKKAVYGTFYELLKPYLERLHFETNACSLDSSRRAREYVRLQLRPLVKGIRMDEHSKSNLIALFEQALARGVPSREEAIDNMVKRALDGSGQEVRRLGDQVMADASVLSESPQLDYFKPEVKKKGSSVILVAGAAILVVTLGVAVYRLDQRRGLPQD